MIIQDKNDHESHSENRPSRPASLLRRFLIIIYDSIALLAIFFLLSAIWVSFNSGEAITTGNRVYPLYLFSLWLAGWFYFALSWRRAGKTLGMRAWRTRLQTDDGKRISWRNSFVRYLTGWLGGLAIGIGFWLSLFREDRATWHDLASHSRLLRDP